MLFKLIGAPATGPLWFARWIAQQVCDAVEQQRRDESTIMAELMELEMRREVGAVSADDYARAEKALFEEMAALRKASTR
jgi:hypothetical protein